MLSIQLSISTQFRFIRPIDWTLSGCNGNKGVLHIPQSSTITGAGPSDCLVSKRGNSLGKSYPSAEIRSMYSTVPADWANCCVKVITDSRGTITFTFRLTTLGKAWTLHAFSYGLNSITILIVVSHYCFINSSSSLSWLSIVIYIFIGIVLKSYRRHKSNGFLLVGTHWCVHV